MKTNDNAVRRARRFGRWLLGALLLCGSHPGATETVTYYHHDALGSPIAATDAAGAVIWRESYRPFGTPIRRETPEPGISYTGKPHHEAFGLSYFGARWYSPELGRFVSVDPIDGVQQQPEHLFNRYAYANNNPYKFVDPDGRLPIIPIAVFVGKELLSYAVEHYTGYSVPISAKGAGKQLYKSLGKAVGKSGKGVASKSPIVIGENMNRVKEYATKTGGKAYRPWKNGDTDIDTAMKRNQRWIVDRRREGREIIDIGPDFQRREATGVRSPFYEMEREVVKGYGNRKQVFSRSRSQSGVKGLDY